MHWICIGKILLGITHLWSNPSRSATETKGVASASQWCKFEVDISMNYADVISKRSNAKSM